MWWSCDRLRICVKQDSYYQKCVESLPCFTGITFPSGEVQKSLLLEVYKEAGVDPSEVAYVEAHGTGTKAGDPQEINTVTDVFCSNGRKGPLLIGSTKSNMGHPEPASGTCLVN